MLEKKIEKYFKLYFTSNGGIRNIQLKQEFKMFIILNLNWSISSPNNAFDLYISFPAFFLSVLCFRRKVEFKMDCFSYKKGEKHFAHLH